MYTACGIMHQRSCLLVTTSTAGSFSGTLYHKLYIESSALEEGRNYRPKHVQLIEITNKLLLLRLVGCLYNCISVAQSHKHKKEQILFMEIKYK